MLSYFAAKKPKSHARTQNIKVKAAFRCSGHGPHEASCVSRTFFRNSLDLKPVLWYNVYRTMDSSLFVDIWHQEFTQIATEAQNIPNHHNAPKIELCAYKAPLHLSRILYKSILFMQNKPNFPNSQMYVCIFSQMAYEYKHNWTLGQNKPNQTQFAGCRKTKTVS